MTPSTYVPDTGDLIWTEFDPTRGREQAGSDRRCQAHRWRASFLDRFTTDIRAPIKSAGIRRSPFLWAFVCEQLLQSEARGGGADHDVAVARLDLDALAVTDPGGLRDVARDPDRQAPSPSANSDLRHDFLRVRRDISSIFLY